MYKSALCGLPHANFRVANLWVQFFNIKMLIFSLISINYSINQHHCIYTNPLVQFLLPHCPFCCCPTCQTLSISVYESPSTIFRSFLICSCSSGHSQISSLASSPCLASLSRNCLISSSSSSESPLQYPQWYVRQHNGWQPQWCARWHNRWCP